MQKTTSLIHWPVLMLMVFSGLSLRAQNPDAVLRQFKVYSYFANGPLTDSLVYIPEPPGPGPVIYVEDSLEIFSTAGFFELRYLPEEAAVFTGIWADLNQDGVFDKQELLYSGAAKEGNLTDDLQLPLPDEPIRLLLAISTREGLLNDPQAITGNSEISSLQFIIRSSPPKLTMTSKKDTRDTLENYCLSLPMEMISGAGFPCMIIQGWALHYPAGASAAADSNVIKLPAGTLFSVGDTVDSGDYVAFELDFSGFPIDDGDQVEFICYYQGCDDPLLVDSVSFTFTKDCTIDRVLEQERYIRQISIYPNPVQIETRIAFELMVPGQVQLLLSDQQGRLLQNVQHTVLPTGMHELRYRPAGLVPGIYWLSLRTTNAVVTKKIVILSP